MIGTLKKYIQRHSGTSQVKEKGVVEAYDIWSANYDRQPGNLMLDLDEILFSKLLGGIDIKGKAVADIGCGTGRHWQKIMALKPAQLTGFDVSPGMLAKLQEKFPTAQTHLITDDLFLEVKDKSYDVILSTLTVAHIENIKTAINAWGRILKRNGDVILTDFHPDALAIGGKRTFKHQQTQIAVQNHVHPITIITELFKQNEFEVINRLEMNVDESVKHYYADQNALHVYDKFYGRPVIYGLHLRRA